MSRIILLPFLAFTLFAWGCSTASKSAPPSTNASEKPATPTPKPHATILEGSWIGRETTPERDGAATMNFSGQMIEFHGASENDWLKGTFTLKEDTNPKQFFGTITDCGAPDYIGKKALAIFTLENGTLTIGGNGPDEAMPSSMDEVHRKFVLKRNP